MLKEERNSRKEQESLLCFFAFITSYWTWLESAFSPTQSAIFLFIMPLVPRYWSMGVWDQLASCHWKSYEFQWVKSGVPQCIFLPSFSFFFFLTGNGLLHSMILIRNYRRKMKVYLTHFGWHLTHFHSFFFFTIIKLYWMKIKASKHLCFPFLFSKKKKVYF